MRIIGLSASFYNEYSNYPEILHKPLRPYYCIEIEINKVLYAIPFRHHIRHPYCFKTVGDAGLDYSKAVIIDKPSYIVSEQFRIDDSEWKIVKDNENEIRKNFQKYINTYKRALRNPNSPRSRHILQYSTLKYFLS